MVHLSVFGRYRINEVFCFNTAWRSSAQGVPLLTEATTVFECRNRHRHEEGDHVIFIGEVEQCSHQAGHTPLLYHAGRMHTGGLG